jgi:hypothetical protein
VSPERVSMICARNEGSDAGGKSRFSMSRDNPYGIPRGSCGGEGGGEGEGEGEEGQRVGNAIPRV